MAVRGATFETTTTFFIEECYSCGIAFAFTEDFHRQKLNQAEDGQFYCPNGHCQHYVGKSLKDQLKEARRKEASALEEARVLAMQRDQVRKELRNAARRGKAAMCPVAGCNRQIIQLARHLHTKHPEYVHPETPSEPRDV
jgi:hypothetical protein